MTLRRPFFFALKIASRNSLTKINSGAKADLFQLSLHCFSGLQISLDNHRPEFVQLLPPTKHPQHLSSIFLPFVLHF